MFIVLHNSFRLGKLSEAQSLHRDELKPAGRKVLSFLGRPWADFLSSDTDMPTPSVLVSPTKHNRNVALHGLGQAHGLTKQQARWVKALQKTVPTCAFRASITNPFGKGSLISLLRQFSSLHADRKQISVGLVGYPNVGKSSVLNALLGKKACTVAPVPGETKVWQFVRLVCSPCLHLLFSLSSLKDFFRSLKATQLTPRR